MLDGQRSGFLEKLAGLSDADARRSTVESGTNLAGLLQHLTFVESMWFEEIVAGGTARRGNRSMEVDPSVSLRSLRPTTAPRAPRATRSSPRSATPTVPVTRNGKTRDLRWVILVVVQETARHVGHADIIREQIDGRTGR